MALKVSQAFPIIPPVGVPIQNGGMTTIISGSLADTTWEARGMICGDTAQPIIHGRGCRGPTHRTIMALSGHNAFRISIIFLLHDMRTALSGPTMAEIFGYGEELQPVQLSSMISGFMHLQPMNGPG